MEHPSQPANNKANGKDSHRNQFSSELVKNLYFIWDITSNTPVSLFVSG